MRKMFLIVGICWSLAAFPALAVTPHSPLDDKDPYTIFVEKIAKFALQFRGVPYNSGGSSPSGFDCSGFVKYVFSRFDMNVARNSQDLSRHGFFVEADYSYPGDLIFFRSSRSADSSIGHVGIIIANDENGVRFVHASTSQGVIISNLNESYYTQRFHSIKRVVDAFKDYPYNN